MQLNELGRLVEQCWREIPSHYGHIELGAWQVMPNHFHGLVRICQSGKKGLGEVMNMFKGSVTREWRRASGAYDDGSRHGGKERGERVWAPNYYDVICFNAEELAVRERYIRANPRRWALRDVPRGRLRMSLYVGNRGLLKLPVERRALRVSRRASEADIVRLKQELSGFSGVVCSTFFSAGEREILQGLLGGDARIIWVVPMGMPASIPVRWTEAFLGNRALWISAYADEMKEATRESCEQSNQRVEQFCGRWE